MSPRSRSRSVTSRRSYTRSPDRRTGRRKSYSHQRYESRSSSSPRNPPSPPPISVKRHRRHSRESRSVSRSASPRYQRHHSSHRRRHSSSRSKSKSRSPRDPYDKTKRNEREKPLPCRCIGIFGLSVYTTQQKIREIFGKYGPIERIQVVIDAQTGRSRGFCFIYYDNLADARAARDNCCGMEIDGRRIRVAYSITERPHTPTPGVYMGRSTKILRERYRAQQRHHSPLPSNSRSHRHRYERSRSRSYSPRRHRY